MQLTPRYGTDPIIRFEGDPSAIAVPAVRQRRRMIEILESFDRDQWMHPTRCAGWTVRDVIVHLESTNTFWSYSIACGLAGEPTRFLATFDPVASPAKLVVDAGDIEPAVLMEGFAASTEALCARLEELDDASWALLAEAPPGHVTITALAHHALWDSWVHERDILLPMGAEPTAEPDEVAAVLTYAAALSPAFAVSLGQSPGGILALDAVGPDVTAVIEVREQVTVRAGRDVTADLTLRGDAVLLAEALSVRCPLAQAIEPKSAWFLSGLATIFDAPGS